MTHKIMDLARELCELQEWDHWDHMIPFIKFPQEWSVKARPNFLGTIIRYDVREDASDNCISVYLDCYDVLGIMHKPYWEVYPDVDGDATRVDMEDIKRLLETIKLSFQHWNDES